MRGGTGGDGASHTWPACEVGALGGNGLRGDLRQVVKACPIHKTKSFVRLSCYCKTPFRVMLGTWCRKYLLRS